VIKLRGLAAGLAGLALLTAGCKKDSAESATAPLARTFTGQGDELSRLARLAQAAARSNDVETAAIILQDLRYRPSLSAEQLTAVQDSLASLQTRLAAAAERNDPAALRAIELLRQGRRR
jgi:hypothetical protein